MKKFYFDSPHEWVNFCEYLRQENRYVLNGKWKKFIENLLFTAKKREHVLLKGGALYRARIGQKEEELEDEFYVGPLDPLDMHAPSAENALEGRVNPRGIPYLYLANDQKTAIAEVRPWLGQGVTVGFFGLTRNLKVVDASRDKHSRHIYNEKGYEPSKKWEPFVWRDINNAFSRPVNKGEENSQYVPTQYISECFKNAGYDGIVYKSSLTKEGYNVALFDVQTAYLSGAFLYEIKSIDYGFIESGNPYICNNKIK